MSDSAPQLNICWSELLIEELVRCGATGFAFSSGARSAPLAVAMARHPAIRPSFHYDERTAAFFALGHARATGKPAIWLTTSGTAVANGYPAVIEAAMDGVPLILITADRPPELRHAGANQTIDQVGLFGSYVRWHVDLPCPDPAIDPRYLLSTIDQAWTYAQAPNPGPVHLNCMFREPLLADAEATNASAYLAPVTRWQGTKRPWTDASRGSLQPAAATVKAVRELMEQAERGVVVLGRMNRRDADTLRPWLRDCPWPVVADAASGFRQDDSIPMLIPYASILIELADADWPPDLILHIGNGLVSRSLLQWMSRSSAHYLRVANHPRKEDPLHAAEQVIECDFGAWTTAMPWDQGRPTPAWVDQWTAQSKRLSDILAADAETTTALNEVSAIRAVAQHLHQPQWLMIGNSMPVRDFDRFAPAVKQPASVVANRGASGIDGLISTACGYAAATRQPGVVVLGDLSALHDLGGLDYVRRSPVPITVLVLNNDGGGIFSFLPLKSHSDIFESVFGTPHGLHFESAARMFELEYQRVTSVEELQAALGDMEQCSQSRVIEIMTNREENVQLHRHLRETLGNALGDRDFAGADTA